MSRRELHLGAFFMLPGQHAGAWRHPATKREQLWNPDYLADLARTAEKGKFDLIFVADGVTAGYTSSAFEYGARLTQFEPLTMFAYLAAVTDKIGFVATASTTYNEPFNLARQFASLDHLSKGRAGWNVVTSTGEEAARNFGKSDKDWPHHLRYERAHEFLDIVKKLWDSWEDDAILYDQDKGVFADKSKVHRLNYEGKQLSVGGPLNIGRPPQGYPVIVQAGYSEAGRELAARTAEAVFTAWQTLEEAQAFYRDVKGRLAKYGRSPDELVIMPGVFPIIGRTEKEAREKKQYLEELVPLPVGVARLSLQLGVDLSPYDVDGPLPKLPPVDEINGNKSRFELIRTMAERENLTIRQVISRVITGRGHWDIVGTPEQIADQLQEWFENGACDGFNVMPPVFPDSLNEFVEEVIPILQHRGLFRKEYTGSTLREHLGLKRPVNQFARQAVGQG